MCNFMTTRLTIGFLLLFNLAYGQKTEQIALDFLLSGLIHQDILFEDGRSNFNADSNMVWYAPKIIDGHGKVSIPKAHKANVDWFYKVIHDHHDIHIRTYKAKETPDGYLVSFKVTTTYDYFTNFVVTLDKDKRPLCIKVTDQIKAAHNSGRAQFFEQWCSNVIFGICKKTDARP